VSKRGTPGRQVATVKEKTVHAHLTKQRIQAIVGQVIDELEQRRAKGKSDYVAMLADEIEKGGIAAWRSLRDLLPADELPPGGGNQFNFGSVFVAAVSQATQRTIPTTPAGGNPPLPIIDVPVTEVPAELETQHTTSDETEEVDW
jgi:hypothetical protein